MILVLHSTRRADGDDKPDWSKSTRTYNTHTHTLLTMLLNIVSTVPHIATEKPECRTRIDTPSSKASQSATQCTSLTTIWLEQLFNWLNCLSYFDCSERCPIMGIIKTPTIPKAQRMGIVGTEGVSSCSNKIHDVKHAYVIHAVDLIPCPGSFKATNTNHSQCMDERDKRRAEVGIQTFV